MRDRNKLIETREVVHDFAGATAETGVSMFLESLPELGIAAAELIGSEAVGATIQAVTSGLLGAIAPGIMGAKLSFQQKRLERNMLKTLDSLKRNQMLIEQRLDALSPDVCQKFIDGSYRDVFLDNVVAENQEQKVQDNINGYINLMGVVNPNDDMVFTFFDTLSQMNQLDIRVLRWYRPTYGMSDEEYESLTDLMNDADIDYVQYNYVREKLCRLGMLTSKNDEMRDENLETLGKTVTELIKQLYAKKPKEVKSPKLKRISRSESYRITRLGREYLDFIEEPK